MIINFLFSALVIGTLLTLAGISLLIEALFGINIPIFKTFFALIIIYLGFMLITGSFSTSDKSTGIRFTKQTTTANNETRDYSIFFSSGLLDFSKIDPAKPMQTKLNIIFSNNTLLLNPAIPTIIKAHSALSNVTFPHETNIYLGNSTYKSHPEGTIPVLEIEANVALSNLEIRNS